MKKTKKKSTRKSSARRSPNELLLLAFAEALVNVRMTPPAGYKLEPLDPIKDSYAYQM